MFWPYAGMGLIAILTVWMIAIFSITALSVNGIMDFDIRIILGIWIILSGLYILSIAAAVARRLHDSGRAGFWGLMPLPFLVIGFGIIIRDFASLDEDVMMNIMPIYMIDMLCYFASLGYLIYLLVRRGDDGGNHYGPSPY